MLNTLFSKLSLLCRVILDTSLSHDILSTFLRTWNLYHHSFHEKLNCKTILHFLFFLDWFVSRRSPVPPVKSDFFVLYVTESPSFIKTDKVTQVCGHTDLVSFVSLLTVLTQSLLGLDRPVSTYKLKIRFTISLVSVILSDSFPHCTKVNKSFLKRTTTHFLPTLIPVFLRFWCQRPWLK